MRFTEITENYSPEEDQHNKLELSDTRKHRLTLTHLSKLRRIREYRKYNEGIRKQKVKQIYGPKAEGGEDGGDLF